MARPIGLMAAREEGDPPLLSWSTVRAPALVLGRLASDPPVDRTAAAADAVTIVRRASGGGAVLWDAGIVALDIMLPRGHPLAPDDVVAAYRWIGEATATALTALGVEGVEVVSIERARAAPVAPRAAAVACFGGLSPFEVTARGRKVVGLSQARRRGGTLLQLGVALTFDAPRLARLMGGGDELAHDLDRVAAGLDGAGRAHAAAEVVAALDASIGRAAGADLRTDRLTPTERAAIDRALAAPDRDPSGHRH